MTSIITAEHLQADWPAWHLWRSQGGSWMATRVRTLTDAEMRSGLGCTLMEGTADELLTQLLVQQARESALTETTSAARSGPVLS
ncbi:MAG: hypothetical protein ABIS86_19165 [Streptosporangiaceae bacterium]